MKSMIDAAISRSRTTLLLMLMAFAFYNDINRLVSG